LARFPNSVENKRDRFAKVCRAARRRFPATNHCGVFQISTSARQNRPDTKGLRRFSHFSSPLLPTDHQIAEIVVTGCSGSGPAVEYRRWGVGEMLGYESLAHANGRTGSAMSSEVLFQMGLRCCSGRDAALDLVSAHKWFNIAAMRGCAEAKSYRSELSREMSKREIATAQRMAREWLAKN
jgi:hypothetical protein